MRRTAAMLLIIALAVIAGSIVSGCGLSSAEAESEALRVLPFPNTPDASPLSEITFLTLSPPDFKTVIVEGSTSGVHTGELVPLPDGRGTTFLSDGEFAPGELVSVSAELTSATAGTAAGAANATHIDFDFTIASPPEDNIAISLLSDSSHSAESPTQSFHSRPDLQPPVVTVLESTGAAGQGYVFVDAQLAPQNGPMIIDDQGDLVWFKPMPENTWALDFRVQSYRDEPVLTWWQGEVLTSGYGVGKGLIVGPSYEEVAVVRAGAGYEADVHEFLLTPRGTALLTIYEPTQANLTSVAGPRDGIVLDSIIQEIDIETGRVLWEWHAFGHVPLSASYASKPTTDKPWDFFHINSIEETPEGNLIVSARNTWAVYEVNREDGTIVWQLGGKGSSFRMRAGAQFEWQHDARLQPDGTLTVFDNAASPQQKNESRAIRLSLDRGTMTARLLSSYLHAPPLLAGSQGNTQVLPSGNIFVGWGDQGYFSEFTNEGAMLFDAKLPPPVQSYRAYRFPWVGRPAESLSVSLSETRANRLTIYASWNGATEVANWQVLGGADAETLFEQTTTAANGFETAISISDPSSYLVVRALDDAGHVLGASSPVSP